MKSFLLGGQVDAKDTHAGPDSNPELQHSSQFQLNFPGTHIKRQNSSVVRLLRTDPMISGSNPPSAKIFAKSEQIRQLFVIPGVGIARCGHIARKDLRSSSKFCLEY